MLANNASPGHLCGSGRPCRKSDVSSRVPIGWRQCPPPGEVSFTAPNVPIVFHPLKRAQRGVTSGGRGSRWPEGSGAAGTTLPCSPPPRDPLPPTLDNGASIFLAKHPTMAHVFFLFFFEMASALTGDNGRSFGSTSGPVALPGPSRAIRTHVPW